MALRVRTHVRTGQAAAAQGGGGGSLILDTLGVTAKCAFSTRKLRTAYAGAALQVRRSSDSTTQDIGFDGSGNLDTAALATFVGANSGFISKWYDQSGNAADAVQATAGNQPRIVNAGTNDVVNGKPAVNFLAGSQALVSPASSGLTNTAHLNAVATIGNLGFNAIIGSSGSVGLEIRTTTNGAIELLQQAQASIATGTNSQSINTQHIIEASYIQTGAYQIWFDGTSVASGSAAHTVTAGQVTFGFNGAADNLTGMIAESIIFDLVGGLSGRTTLEADQKTYWGTP